LRQGRPPANSYWDDEIGYNRCLTTNDVLLPGTKRRSPAGAAKRKAQNASHRRTTDAARKENAEQQHRSYTKRVQRSRNRRHLVGRCNETLFKPGFDLSLVDYDDAGIISDASKCHHCGALQFGDELMPSKRNRGQKRGRSCCSDGDVWLPPVQKHARLDALWTDVGDAKAKLLREFARKFNNAMALAYEEVLEPDLADGSNWQPSVVIQGKLYHRIGPLTTDENKTKAFAQLYVHDASANDDIAATRRQHMYLPKQTSKAKRETALALLRELLRARERRARQG